MLQTISNIPDTSGRQKIEYDVPWYLAATKNGEDVAIARKRSPSHFVHHRQNDKMSETDTECFEEVHAFLFCEVRMRFYS